MPSELRLVIRRPAQADILEARSWYDRESRTVGDRFLHTLNARLRALIELPNLWPVVGKGVRRAPVKGFPYSVYYTISPHRLTVVAVAHHRRDPLIWRRRVGLNELPGLYTASGER
jgi:plasmid stabilization system protein ParE